MAGGEAELRLRAGEDLWTNALREGISPAHRARPGLLLYFLVLSPFPRWGPHPQVRTLGSLRVCITSPALLRSLAVVLSPPPHPPPTPVWGHPPAGSHLPWAAVQAAVCLCVSTAAVAEGAPRSHMVAAIPAGRAVQAVDSSGRLGSWLDPAPPSLEADV